MNSGSEPPRHYCEKCKRPCVLLHFPPVPAVAGDSSPRRVGAYWVCQYCGHYEPSAQLGLFG